ncbi:MAG: M56 family metallopeptidase [Cyanobacteria bacterium P01_C01_bin.73]
MVILIGAIAWGIRARSRPDPANTPHRWRQSLLGFVAAPLLLVSTALSIVCMGPRGNMVAPWEGWLTYAAAWIFLGYGCGLLVVLAFQGYLAERQIKALEIIVVHNQSARLLPTDLPYSAQVGLWRAELVISQGLIDQLDGEHLAAVLAHEQAHLWFQDTLWSFWLGWLRRWTSWLPHSQSLWEELMFLRELRADAWATQQTSRFVLAESLVQVAQSPNLQSPNLHSPDLTEPLVSAPFSCAVAPGRLAQRVDLLLVEDRQSLAFCRLPWVAIAPTLIPLLAIPFHH